jgi:hypothetical protein
MPFELDVDADPEVVAVAEDVAAGVDDVLLELDPQADEASAASTSRTAVEPRRDRAFTVFIIIPLYNGPDEK